MPNRLLNDDVLGFLHLRSLVVSSLRVVVTESYDIASTSITEHEVDLAGGKVVVGLSVDAVLGSKQSNESSVSSVSVRSPHISPH